jgi:hypothetical protein
MKWRVLRQDSRDRPLVLFAGSLAWRGSFGQSGSFYRGLPPAIAGAVQNYGEITVFLTYHGRTALLYYLLASGMASNHVMCNWDRGVHITNYLTAPSEVLARRFPIEAEQDKIGQDMARQDKAIQELNKSLTRHSLCQKNN